MRYSVTKERLEEMTTSPTCSFCGGGKEKVGYLFQAQNGLAICDQCVLICAEVISQDEEKEEEEKDFSKMN
jgi:ATP-dependent protease Clp ATPase subunit